MLEALPHNAREVAYWSFALVALGLPAIFAGRFARLGAGVVLANFIASALVQQAQVAGVQIGIMAADLAMFGCLFVLAGRSRRWWVHSAAGFALLSLLSHIGAVTDDAAPDWLWAYITWQWLASGGVLLSVLAACAEAPFAREYEHWAARR